MPDEIYKIVTEIPESEPGHGIWSALARGRAAVRYPPPSREEEGWITAPSFLAEQGYGICVWPDLDSALWFAGLCGTQVAVYLAEAEGAISPLPPMCEQTALALGRVHQIVSSYHLWPLGTRMYRRVRLARRIGQVV